MISRYSAGYSLPLELRICSTTRFGRRPHFSRISAFSASVAVPAGGSFFVSVRSFRVFPPPFGSCLALACFWSGFASCFSFSACCFSALDFFFWFA